MKNTNIHIESADPGFRSLYKIGGISALILVVITLGEVVFFTFYPQPETVQGWFALFRYSTVLGLVDFWGLEIIMYILFIPVFLALYHLLRKVNHGLMAIALIFVLIGAGVFFVTNNPFTMLTLSSKYAAASTEVQRSALLAAGEAVLANTNQRAVGGFNIALFLVSVAGIIVSSGMGKHHSFRRITVFVGILAHGFSLADYIRQAATQSAVIALLIILPGSLFLILWFIFLGLKLIKLGRAS